MLLTAGAALANAVIAALGVHLFNAAFERRAAPLQAGPGRLENTELTVRVGLAAIAIVMAASAIVVTLLALRVGRGDGRARAIAWAAGALVTLLALVTVCSAVVSRSTLTFAGADPRNETATALVRAAQSAVPAWFGVAIGGLSGLIVVGYISSSILLALPAATAYFTPV